MARNDEEKQILALELEASQIGYGVVEKLIQVGELELSNQFRWIAGNLMPERMTARSPAEFASHMLDATGARRAQRDLAGVRFGVSNELWNGLDGKGWVHRHNEGAAAHAN